MRTMLRRSRLALAAAAVLAAAAAAGGQDQAGAEATAPAAARQDTDDRARMRAFLDQRIEQLEAQQRALRDAREAVDGGATVDDVRDALRGAFRDDLRDGWRERGREGRRRGTRGLGELGPGGPDRPPGDDLFGGDPQEPELPLTNAQRDEVLAFLSWMSELDQEGPGRIVAQLGELRESDPDAFDRKVGRIGRGKIWRAITDWRRDPSHFRRIVETEAAFRHLARSIVQRGGDPTPEEVDAMRGLITQVVQLRLEAERAQVAELSERVAALSAELAEKIERQDEVVEERLGQSLERIRVAAERRGRGDRRGRPPRGEGPDGPGGGAPPGD